MTASEKEKLRTKISSDRGWAEALREACEAGDDAAITRTLHNIGIDGVTTTRKRLATNCPPECVPLFDFCLC